jgi:carbamoyl-phosphate synthase large subunit
MAEDRDLFRAMMDKLGIPMPESGMAVTVDDALKIANEIGYPLMVRPSYVLGGLGMEVVYNDEDMTFYMNAAVGVTPDRPYPDRPFLHHATECRLTPSAMASTCSSPQSMEHIELAGIHSGDSACVLPPKGLTDEQIATIKEYTNALQRNERRRSYEMQYAIEDGKVYS